MKLNTVIERIPLWYQTATVGWDRDTVKCYYLKSPPGRGKTSVLSSAPKLLAEKLGKNLGLVIINGPLLTPSDAVGYLIPRHHETYSESIYTRPFWWVTREGKPLEEYDGGIIVVDEADKMDTDTKKVIGEAALSGRLGPHVLPPGWVVWMAGNTSADRSGSTKELDHLINRRMEIDVTDDLESLLDWMAANGVMPLTQAFTQQNPQVVFSEKPEKQGAWCTPRSIVMLDAHLQTVKEVTGEIPDDSTITEEAGGMVSAGAAAQYFAFVKLEREMPKLERIVAAPKEAKLPQKIDAQMLVCYNLAHRVTEDNAGPVITYIERLPKEFAVTFAKAACKRMPTLVMTQHFQKWALENSSLMAIITAK